MKINVCAGDRIEFNEVPEECDYGDFYGVVLIVKPDHNEVVVEVLSKVNDGFLKTLSFDLDGSSWDRSGGWKRERENPQWLESEEVAKPEPTEVEVLKARVSELEKAYEGLEKAYFELLASV